MCHAVQLIYSIKGTLTSPQENLKVEVSSSNHNKHIVFFLPLITAGSDSARLFFFIQCVNRYLAPKN